MKGVFEQPLRRWFGCLDGISGWLVLAVTPALLASPQLPAAAIGEQAIPVSAPARPPRPVMLGGFNTIDTRTWPDMPRDYVEYHGVTFHITGAIRLGGVRAARERKPYPGAVLGVPVRQRAACVHLLQAAENWRGTSRGDPYGKVVLHYANGETRAFYLRFLVHGMDWWGGTNTPQETVSDPNTRLGWAFRKPDGSYRRLFHTTFTNPLPEVEISAVDFVSPLANANLWLYGLTLSDDAAALAPDATQADVAANRSLVTLFFQDAVGRWQASDDGFQLAFARDRLKVGFWPDSFARAMRRISVTAQSAEIAMHGATWRVGDGVQSVAAACGTWWFLADGFVGAENVSVGRHVGGLFFHLQRPIAFGAFD